MKKLFLVFALAGMFVFAACSGGSQADEAESEATEETTEMIEEAPVEEAPIDEVETPDDSQMEEEADEVTE
jgi:hypothetical protein